MVFGSVILGANTDMNGQGEELCTSSGAKYEANPTAMQQVWPDERSTKMTISIWLDRGQVWVRARVGEMPTLVHHCNIEKPKVDPFNYKIK